MTRSARTARGVTLVELVMVIVVLGILATVMVPLLAKGFEAWFVGRDHEDAQRQAALALERMTRELRVAEAIVVSANEITFERDGAPYSFVHSGGVLAYVSGADSQPIARRVTAASFTDESSDDTRYITVTLQTEGHTGQFRTTIHPRRRQ